VTVPAPDRDPGDFSDLDRAERWAVVIIGAALAAAVACGVWVYVGLPAGEAVEGAGETLAAGE
jgi:hypothetical protein